MNERTPGELQSRGLKLAVLSFFVLWLVALAGPASAEPCDFGSGGNCEPPPPPCDPLDCPPPPSPYTVTNTNDSGAGSLRQAIINTNAAAGHQTIKFDIPGEGVKTIAPTTELPDITDPVTIDGYSQPGARPNTLRQGNDAVLKIELSGANTGSAVSPRGGRPAGLTALSDDVAVRGLVINRFFSHGIFVASGSDRNVVQGNYLGTDATGTRDLGNSADGVFFVGAHGLVGGTEPAARNVISGNGMEGVGFNNAPNRVEGNYIGTTAAGTGPLGNQAGVGTPSNGRSGNTIGGTVPEAGNLIAFNADQGIVVTDPRTTILSNTIHSNGGLGIDLAPYWYGDGVTLNDRGDGDLGPNGQQNYPEIASVTTASGDLVRMEGTLNSTPNTKFLVQLFTGDEPDPSGYGEGRIHGEPENLVRNWEVTTDANGDAHLFGIWPPSVRMAGKWLTATATGPDGTSEFSKAVRIKDLDDPAPETKIEGGPSGPTRASTAAFSFSSSEANSTFQCRLDGAAFADCASPKEYPGLADGEHAFEVRAIDDAGNADPTPETRTFTVDTAAPNTSISSGPAQGGTTKSTSASFGFVASEPVSRFECSLDYAGFSPCASPKAYAGLTNRVHIFQVRAVDRAGNVDPAPATRTWTVDTALPAIASPSPAPSSATRDRTPTVRATVGDARTNLTKTSVQLYVDGVRRTTFAYDQATDRLSYTPAAALSYSRHTAKVVARDAVGNVATRSWSFNVVR